MARRDGTGTRGEMTSVEDEDGYTTESFTMSQLVYGQRQEVLDGHSGEMDVSLCGPEWPAEQLGRANKEIKRDEMDDDEIAELLSLPHGHELVADFAGEQRTGRRVDEYLGGSFGTFFAYRVFREDTGEKEAMKLVKLPMSEGARQSRLRPHVVEAHIMSQLGSHPNLVGIRGFFPTCGDCLTFIELVPFARTLESVIRDHAASNSLSFVTAAEVALMIARGLEFMHERGFTHWDVKPSNVVTGWSRRHGTRLWMIPGSSTSQDLVVVAKIADFGAVTKRGSGDFKACTRTYSSPETLSLVGIQREARSLEQVEGAGATQDDWSWAATLMAMRCDGGDWVAADVGGARRAVKQFKAKAPSSNGPERSLAMLCASLAQECFDAETRQRPTMATIAERLSRGLDEAGRVIARVEGRPEPDLSEHELESLHQSLAMTFSDEGALGASQKDHELAEFHFLERMRLAKENSGPESKEYAFAVSNLATQYLQTGDYVKAKPLYRLLLAFGEETIDPKNDDIIVAMWCTSLCKCLYDQGELDEMIPLYRRAIGIYEEALDDYHREAAAACTNLSQCFMEQGNLVQAKPLLERVIEIRKKSLGPHDALLARTYNTLSTVLMSLGDIDEAKRLLEEALERGKSLGPNHREVGRSYGHLACLLAGEDRDQEALEYFDRAIAIFEKALPSTDPNTKQLKELRADLRQRVAPQQPRVEPQQPPARRGA